MTQDIARIWDRVHSAKARETYPPEDVVRLVARRFFDAPDRNAIRALDVGCGSGPMAWFLAREGFSVAAVDGSQVAVDRTSRRIAREGLNADVRLASSSALPFPDGHFDLCVEMQCFMCNDLSETARMVAEAWRVLRPGGLLVSRTPAVGCAGDGIGTPLGDNCYLDPEDGPFAHMGVVRFLDERDAERIYSPFRLESLDYTRYTLDNRSAELTFLVLACRKEPRP